MRKRILPVSFAFAFSMFGFYVFAPILPSNSSAPSVAIRGMVVLICIFAAVSPLRKLSRSALVLSTPMLLLLVAFLFRIIENAYIKNITLYIGSTQMLGLFIGAAIIPTLCAISYGRDISEVAVQKVFSWMSVIFAIGLLVNYNTLFAPQIDVLRASLERVNAISLTNMAITFLMFFVMFFWKSVTLRITALCLGPLFFIVAAISQSRGPIVAAVLAILLLLLLRFREISSVVFRFGILGTIGIMVVQFFVKVNYFELLLIRFDFSNAQNNTSIIIRQIQWQQAWNQFLDDPLFGRFVFETEFFHYPHNIFLEALMSMGIVGGGLLITHFTIMIFVSRRVLRYYPFPALASFTVVYMWKEAFLSMSSGSIWASSSLWVSCAFLISMSLDKKRKTSE